MSKRRRRPRDLAAILKRGERRVLVEWIRFARRHRNSHWLPLGLFGLLFVDAFVLVIPSLLCVAAAITISPKRWIYFCLLFGFATVCNNTVTYYVGRMLPAATIVEFFQSNSLMVMWEAAEGAIRDYDYYATFFGAILSLPTQVMTLIIGMTDASVLRNNPEATSNLARVMLFVFMGHSIKVFALGAVFRYGWVKLERKVSSEEPSLPDPKDL